METQIAKKEIGGTYNHQINLKDILKKHEYPTESGTFSKPALQNKIDYFFPTLDEFSVFENSIRLFYIQLFGEVFRVFDLVKALDKSFVLFCYDSRVVDRKL